MVKRSNRKIGKQTVRAMLSFGHARFRDLLVRKAQERDWCDVIMCKEDYTSKCCGECGHLHELLGPNKVFKCPECGVTMGRDANGARNILIYWLATHCNAESSESEFG
jgi:putative transposase